MQETPPSSRADAPQKQQPARALRWIGAAVGVLLVLLVGLALFAVFSEPGARLAWRAAERFLPGQLSVDVSGGTLSDGLRLRNLVYEDATRRVRIDRVEGSWRLTRDPLLLTISSLAFGKVDVTTRPAPDEEPAQLPAAIKLPIAIDLRRLTVQEVAIHGDGPALRFRDILLRAESDTVQHRITLEHAETPAGDASASVRLNGEAPFAVDGSARLDGALRDTRYRLDAGVSGTLREPRILLDAQAAGASATADIAATPFADVPLQRAQVRLRALDPKALNEAWPEARLDVTADLSPVASANAAAEAIPTVAGPVEIVNAKPGPLDEDRLPFVSARADIVMDLAQQRLAQIVVTLPGKATVTGSAELRDAGQGRLALEAHSVDLQRLHTKLRATDLDGPFTVLLQGDTQEVHLELSDRELSIAADATLTPERITVPTARLHAGTASLQAGGWLGRTEDGPFEIEGTLSQFNPALFFAQPTHKKQRNNQPAWSPANARINMEFTARGAMRPELQGTLRFDTRNSRYAGMPMKASGEIAFAGKQLLPSTAQVSVAGNKAALKGSFGAPSDRLTIDIDAPALARLGFGLSGRLDADLQLVGTFDQPVVNGEFRAQSLVFGDYRVARLTGEVRADGVPGTSPDATIKLDLDGRDLRAPDISLASIQANIDGTYARHTIEIASAGRAGGRPVDARFSAAGRLRELPQGMAWDGVLSTLENDGFPRLAITEPLQVDIAPGTVELGATRIEIEQAVVALNSFRYADGNIRSAGTLRSLQVARLLELQRQITGDAPPVKTDLILDGEWDVALAERASGFARIERRSGDVRILQDEDSFSIGLTGLAARADLQGMQVAIGAQVTTARLGALSADAVVALQQVDGRATVAPDSALSGKIAGGIPRLRSLGLFLGPALVIEGSAAVNLIVAGTVADPRLSGTAAADQLAVTHYDYGIQLHDGEARLALDNNVVELQRLEFRGGQGVLRATGKLALDQPQENLSAVITAENLQLLSNPSMQMTISGRAQAGTDNGQMRVTGNFVVDRALFSLPEQPAPELGDDVVITRGGERMGRHDEHVAMAAERPASPFSPLVNVQVGLGDNFRFEGSGAELRLEGTLTIRSAPNEQPQAFGTIRVAEGTYEAFGAELEIERGVINFQGSLQNPNVNIVAMRRGQDVAAGVNVTGTVQRPRVQLVSEPNVPDEEKLSWLVFGRAGADGNADAGQAEAAARGAALGLLNKFGSARIAKGVGLDQFSFGQSEFGLAGQQVVNLGKEISDRLYVGYEQSIATAEAILKLTYELSRSWSVVLRGGAVTGLDVYFTKRFDHFRRRSRP